MDIISFEEFKKLEIRIGKVLKAEKVEGADRLLKLEVEFGSARQNSDDEGSLKPKEEEPKRMIRQIVSGIAEFYAPEELVGKQFVFLVNLEPRKFKGVESQGMILAADDSGSPVLLQPEKEVKVGSVVR